MFTRIQKFIVILTSIFFAAATSSFGNSDVSELPLDVRSISAALKLEAVANSENKAISEKISTSPKLQHIYDRLTILEGFDSSGTDDFTNTIKSYEAFAIKSGDNNDIQLSKFFNELAIRYNPFSEDHTNDIQASLKFLENYRGSKNWIVAHSANSISAVLSGYERNFSQAIDYASRSLAVIPEDQSFQAQLSRYYSFSITAYLHGSMKNADMLLTSIDGLIDASLKVGRPVESINFLNNLIYSMRTINDSKIMVQLVDTLIRVGEKHPSDTPGLVEMRAAITLVRLGEFERALKISQKGLIKAENVAIANYLRAMEIQSLAAVGRADVAERKLIKFKKDIATQGDETSFPYNEIYKAQGLIAMARGDAKETFFNLDRHAELSIQRIIKSNNTDTATLLANLENNKAREAEREEARAEMFRLEQEALQHRVDAFRRGLFIVLMLAIAAILSAAFMFYRSRTDKKLAIAAEAALAGEQAKSQFLAVISHELRTPLNGIIGIADLLSRTAPSLDLRRKIGIINNSGQDLLRLVEQILDMSRIDADEMDVFPENTNVREVIDSIDMLWRPTIEGKGVIFTSHVDKSVPDFLTFDPLRLRQCINNLVSNAAKFTSTGRVHMHITAEYLEAEAKSQLTVIVADTGMGIRKDVQDNLFKPFVQADSSITRQYGGSGLGLAITRSLARMMDGDLVVTSRVGAGSEFTLTILANASSDAKLLDTMDALFEDDEIMSKRFAPPSSNPLLESLQTRLDSETKDAESLNIVLEDEVAPEVLEPPSLDTSPSPNLDSLENIRILIVEDVPSNQDVMKIFLEPEGCAIACADNGQHALTALRTQDFDVVLMDIRMPEMHGIEATRLIRSEGGRNSRVPIIALTADATAETNAQCMAAGANIFLTKPIIATELIDSIRFVRRQVAHRDMTAEDAQPRKRA